MKLKEFLAFYAFLVILFLIHIFEMKIPFLLMIMRIFKTDCVICKMSNIPTFYIKFPAISTSFLFKKF